MYSPPWSTAVTEGEETVTDTGHQNNQKRGLQLTLSWTFWSKKGCLVTSAGWCLGQTLFWNTLGVRPKVFHLHKDTQRSWKDERSVAFQPTSWWESGQFAFPKSYKWGFCFHATQSHHQGLDHDAHPTHAGEQRWWKQLVPGTWFHATSSTAVWKCPWQEWKNQRAKFSVKEEQCISLARIWGETANGAIYRCNRCQRRRNVCLRNVYAMLKHIRRQTTAPPPKKKKT